MRRPASPLFVIGYKNWDGWTGRNARIDLRWAEGDVEHLRAQAVELAETTPDVILAGNTLALIARLRASH
jgi:hypothetical protein